METQTANFERLPASAGPPTWRDIGYGGVEATHDSGDETGAIVTTARVVHGGNGLWTPHMTQYAKGRPKKRGDGRTASQCIACSWPGQQRTKEEAVDWCESTWLSLCSENAKVSDGADRKDQS